MAEDSKTIAIKAAMNGNESRMWDGKIEPFVSGDCFQSYMEFAKAFFI